VGAEADRAPCSDWAARGQPTFATTAVPHRRSRDQAVDKGPATARIESARQLSEQEAVGTHDMPHVDLVLPCAHTASTGVQATLATQEAVQEAARYAPRSAAQIYRVGAVHHCVWCLVAACLACRTGCAALQLGLISTCPTCAGNPRHLFVSLPVCTPQQRMLSALLPEWCPIDLSSLLSSVLYQHACRLLHTFSYPWICVYPASRVGLQTICWRHSSDIVYESGASSRTPPKPSTLRLKSPWTHAGT
jgi:hypothetical protein